MPQDGHRGYYLDAVGAEAIGVRRGIGRVPRTAWRARRTRVMAT